MPCDHAIAGAVLEYLAQQVKGLVDCPNTGIRSIIFAFVFHNGAGDGDLGKVFIPVDADIGVSFVIFEPHIILWAMFLNEIHLEDERFQF